MTRTSRRLNALALGSVMVLALASCGDDPAPVDGGESSAAPTDAADTPDDDPTAEATDVADEPEAGDDPVPGEVLGTVVVDGTSYDMDEVRRCEPLEDGPLETELELQARGTVPVGEGYEDQDWVQIDVYIQSVGGMPLNEVSWTGPEGVFGGAPDAVVEVQGDEVTGSAMPVDALTQEGAISVEFALPLPDELIDCRA